METFELKPCPRCGKEFFDIDRHLAECQVEQKAKLVYSTSSLKKYHDKRKEAMRSKGIYTQSRPLYEIASEIKNDWKNIYFGAKPYLEAMFALNSIDDMYGADDAQSVVAYFLANAMSWRGETARRIKAELNMMLKRR